MNHKLLFSLMILLSLGLLNAQLTQTGAISGSVVAEDGSAIPGVSVELRSPALIVEKMATVSNEEGQFRFRNLPPGSYEMIFTLEGMKTMTRKGIVVSVGGTTNINVAMEFGTLTENIEVSGKAPTIDVQATAKTTNISTDMIRSIPTRTRTLAGIFSMAPGVQNGVAHGSGERNNSWNVDGVNTNDPVVGTAGTTPASEVLQEVAVSIGGVSADQASSGGAIINAVTKSGGNEFSGSASVYYNHESLNGDNTKDTVLEGSASGDKFNFNPAISLGGPIIKNKLWFFGSYTLEKSESYVAGYPYGQDEIPLDRKVPYLYGKLTFQPTTNDKIYASYTFSDLVRNHRGAAMDMIESETWKQKGVNHSFNIDWAHTFSNNFFGNLKFASAPVNFSLLCKNDNPWMYDLGTQLTIPDSSYGYSDDYKRGRLQFQTDFTLFIDDFIGQHEWKAGVDYTMSKGDREFSLSNMESPDQPGYYCYYIYYYYGAPYRINFYKEHTSKEKINALSVYLQDTWTPTKNLTLTLGARLENSKGIIPVQNEDATGYFLPKWFGDSYPMSASAVTEEFTAMEWTNISPRLAFSYDLAGDGKTVFKGSYGLYYEALLSQYFSTVNPNGFSNFYGAFDPNTKAITRLVSYSLPQAGVLGYKGEEPTSPYEQHVTLSVERELFEDWSLTVRGIYNQKKNILEDVDMNSVDMDALMNDGTLIWKNWQKVAATDPMTGETVHFWEMIDPMVPENLTLVNIKGQSREYKALEFIVKKRFSKGWMMEASYILSKLEGLFDTDFNATSGITAYYNNPNAHVNAIGRLGNDRRHYLKLLTMVRGPWGINVSANIQYFSGNPYSRTLNSAEEGVSLSHSDDVSIIAGKRGQYVLPDRFNVDMSLAKEFKINNLRFTLFAEAFNLLNQGKATSVQTSTSDPNHVFGEMASINAPFYLRFGFRFDFN